jgi:glycosyltransferase involved in cell wall biosynthesis
MKKIFLESHNINNLNFGFGQFNYHLLKAIANSDEKMFTFYMHCIDTKKYKKEFNHFFKTKQYYSFQRYRIFNIRQKFDLWHSMNQNSKMEPYYKTPYLLTIHNISYIQDYSNYKNLPNHVRFQDKINRSNAIVYISEYAKQSTHQYFEVPEVPEYVIYNGNTIEELVMPENYKPDLVNERPYFFSIGEITERKNFIAIVKMMSFFPEFDLIIAGKNSTKEALQIGEYIHNNNIKNVHLIGKISELDKQYLYKNSQGLLFPSLREGFGLPIIEAMTFGIPCFLSNNTCLPEIGGNLSYYWDEYDPEYMADIVKNGLNHFNNNPNIKNQMLQRSKEFSWSNAADSYLNIYKSML